MKYILVKMSVIPQNVIDVLCVGVCKVMELNSHAYRVLMKPVFLRIIIFLSHLVNFRLYEGF